MTERFTIVFEGDIRKFAGNPLKTETPFGVPYTVAVGDIIEQFNELQDSSTGAPAARQVPLAVLEGQIERLRKNDFAGMETMRTFALNIIDDLLNSRATAAPSPELPWYCPPSALASTEPDAVREARDKALTECVDIALAIDSGRGNERTIADTIRALKSDALARHDRQTGEPQS